MTLRKPDRATPAPGGRLAWRMWASPPQRQPALDRRRFLPGLALAWVLAGSPFAAARAQQIPASIEVNTANQAELEMVTGIGPELSGRLLAERARSAFKDWADLQQRLSGIGPVRAAKLSAAGLKVQGQAYPAAPPPPAASAAR